MKVIEPIWDWIEQHYNKERYLIIYGASGSGKSYTMAQFLVVNNLLQGHQYRTLITRKTWPSLRESAYRLIKEFLDRIGIEYQENKQEHVIKFNRNEFIFRSIDDPHKLKSTEFNYVWMEEATEFTEQDFQFLDINARRYNVEGLNQIFMTFNPIKTSWVYEHFWERRLIDNTAILNTKYEINPFLDKRSIEAIENLKNQNKAMWKIYAKGEFAEPENIVYQNWDVVDTLPATFDEVIYGGDFGFNNPTAVLKIGMKDGEIYIIDEIYKTQMTNDDLIRELGHFYDNKSNYSFWDSAEPNRIEEIRRAGYNAHPAEKSVKEGINKVKEFRIHIHSKCVNTIKEIKTYSFKTDKSGHVLDEPVKFLDHAMDAMRYAIFTYFKNKTTQGVAVWTL